MSFEIPTALPSADQWREQTSQFFKPRSSELKQLDIALANFESNKSNDTFDEVEKSLHAWLQTKPLHNSSRDTPPIFPVTNLVTAVQDARAFLNQKDAIQTEVEIPKTIHLAWVGSVPPDDVLKSAKIWANSQPDCQVNIWTDKNNLLANDFRKSTAAMREEVDLSTAPDPAIATRIRTWKDNADYATGLDALLTAQHSSLTSKLTTYQQDLDSLATRLSEANSQIAIRDVSELLVNHRQGSLSGTPGSLSAADRNTLRKAYQRELGERCNPAAASDIVRLVAVHDEPGLYVDTDITPPIAEFPKLADSLKAAGIDMPVNSSNDLLNNQTYLHVIAAVEERIDQLSLGPDSKISPQGPEYDKLIAFAESIGKAGEVRSAFDAWSDDIKHRIANPAIGTAFEKLDSINVAPVLFKVRQLSTIGGASSNSAIATSRADAPALAKWAKKIGELTEAAVATPEKKHRYYNDLDGDYKDRTLNTTGPASLNMNLLLTNELKEFGILKEHSSIIIPFRNFPNPGRAEMDHSWLQKPDAHSHTAPSTTPPGSSSSSVQPQRRASSERTDVISPQLPPQRRPDSPRQTQPSSTEGPVKNKSLGFSKR
ncbi:TcdA/TcdB catalytic glycosyltransferase domain-containing protein [Chitinimonas sp. PSY-7]|uniref:TcdA/TcdB catalytic glycosyltransferase domain-containing protein n=1 Tax=Chitinimonas sp. PSY-7 TaxID=3459088 RepID=UPI00404011D0